MPQDLPSIRVNESQEKAGPPEQPMSLEQEAPLAERGVAEMEAGEIEKPPERVLEQTPVRTAPAAPPAKDDEKINILKEAEKLRDIKFEGRKIEHLINLAQTKGVDFAIEVAQKTNDACLLDLLHDKLIEQKLKP